ncbi:MAG TPA: hypothetical protein VFE50_26635 [Cyclobacteriaceae bacterium]|nr:hypothetical protein [Cyclobacteriaceae bacterium]
MRVIIFSFLVFALLSCEKEPFKPAAVPEKVLWEDINVNIEPDIFPFIYTFNDELFLAGRKKVVALNKNLETRLVTTFDKVPFENPYPVISNGIFVTSVLKSHLVPDGSGLKSVDTVTIHLIDTRNGLKGQFNLTAIRAEVAGVTNMGFYGEVAAVNSNNEIIVLFKNYDIEMMQAVIFKIEKTSSQLKLTNRRIISIGPVDDVTGLYAVDKNFIVSLYNRTYRIDGSGNVSAVVDKGLAGAPFYFNGKWNFLALYTAYYESPDGDTWKSIGGDRAYGAATVLGVHNDKLWFRQENKNGIYFTNDLKTIEEFKPDNFLDLNGLQLRILDGYLYAKELHGTTLHRVKLPAE